MIDLRQLLDQISTACLEIDRALAEHLAKTSNPQYKMDIEKDMITLGNLRLIMAAVKEDVGTDMVGASSELLLRIAANEFRNKLVQIPEKRGLQKEIIQSLKEAHSCILKLIRPAR